MKKLLILIPILLFLLTGYTFPQNKSFYIKGDCTIGNNVTIYIPYNQNYRFEVNGNEIINCYSSSVSGYTEQGYTVTFPTFNTPYYRPNTTTVNITWTNITDYRLPDIDSPDSNIGTVIMVCSVFIIAIMLFKR